MNKGHSIHIIFSKINNFVKIIVIIYHTFCKEHGDIFQVLSPMISMLGLFLLLNKSVLCL